MIVMQGLFVNRLKDELKPLYRDLFEHTKEYCEGKKIVSFAAQWGNKYPETANEGLLFVGRATNGWLNDDANVDNLFEGKDRIFNRDDQMIWVKEKEGDADWNSNHSAFWRVVRGVARNFYPDDELEHIAWSNLCKLAFNDKERRSQLPTQTLYNLQLNDANKILNKEIEILSPKFVIILTNKWAVDFIPRINCNAKSTKIKEEKWLKYMATVYKNDEYYVIHSECPERKKWQEHIDCLTNLINQFK